MGTQGGDGHLQAQGRGRRRNQPCPQLHLGLPASRTWDDKCLLPKLLLCGALSWLPEGTHTPPRGQSGWGGVVSDPWGTLGPAGPCGQNPHGEPSSPIWWSGWSASCSCRAHTGSPCWLVHVRWLHQEDKLKVCDLYIVWTPRGDAPSNFSPWARSACGVQGWGSHRVHPAL